MELEKIGTKRNRLTLIARHHKDGRSQRYNLYRCDCGTEKVIRESSVRFQEIQSCGCFGREQRRKAVLKHGQTTSREYSSWEHMQARCRNRRFKQWDDYGGRGIKVCGRWSSFENFLADMGKRPAGKTLDRIDNNGNYEPANCKWSTPSEQQFNRRICAKRKETAQS